MWYAGLLPQADLVRRAAEYVLRIVSVLAPLQCIESCCRILLQGCCRRRIRSGWQRSVCCVSCRSRAGL